MLRGCLHHAVGLLHIGALRALLRNFEAQHPHRGMSVRHLLMRARYLLVGMRIAHTSRAVPASVPPTWMAAAASLAQPVETAAVANKAAPLPAYVHTLFMSIRAYTTIQSRAA